MSRAVYVLGGGGHACSVLDALLAGGVEVAGVLDPSLSVATMVLGVPILGDDAFLQGTDATDCVLVNGLGANPRVERRAAMFESMKQRGFSFAAVKHPSVVVGRESHLGEGAQLLSGAILQARVHVGDNAVVNTSASVDHDCVIGRNAFVAPGAVLCGNVTVGEGTFIGAGATVLPGITLGANAIIGAGCVVTRHVEAKGTVTGNPGERMGRRT